MWEAHGCQRFPQQVSSVLVYVFFHLQFRCFLKPSPCSGVWISGFLVTKGTCHQVVSLPPLLQVLALPWAQFDLLLLLLAKAGSRVTNILGCGTPGNFSQLEKNILDEAKILFGGLNRIEWNILTFWRFFFTSF